MRAVRWILPLVVLCLTLPADAGGRPGRKAGSYKKDLGAYARKAGVRTTGKSRSVERRIVDKEVRKAKRLGLPNASKVVRAANRRFQKAQRMVPPRQRILYGFSHLVDQKLSVKQSVVDALMRVVDKKKFDSYLARGPKKNGTWGRSGLIDDPSELAAAILHHERYGAGKAKQLSISANLQKKLQAAFEGLPVDSAPGGAGLFGANISSSFENVKVSFHSPQIPSPLQAGLFSPKIRVVTPETDAKGLAPNAVAKVGGDTKINFAFETQAGQELNFGGEKVKTGPYHRIILSSKATYDPVFDPKLTKTQLRELARSNDIFVAVGLHYLTGLSPALAKKRGALLRRQLKTMREANPSLYVHNSYVVPRNGALEAQLFSQIHGLYDSIDLNSAELTQLARNLDGATLGDRKVRMPSLAHKNGNPENPTRIFTLARALLEATQTERVRIHARWFDLTLVRTNKNVGTAVERMKRESSANHFARAVTTNKVANPSGQIRTAKDRWPVVASLPARSFQEVGKLIDHVARTRSLSATQKEGFRSSEILMAAKNGGVSIVVTPAREFYDFSGGLISAGDTLALTALQAVGPELLNPLKSQ